MANFPSPNTGAAAAALVVDGAPERIVETKTVALFLNTLFSNALSSNALYYAHMHTLHMH